MSQINNYTEMHGELANDIQAEYISFLGKYRVKSKNELGKGRGITADGQVGAIGANSVPNKNAGWFRYYMTPKAWEKLIATNDVVLNLLLD